MGGVLLGSSARNGAGPGAHGAPGSHRSLQQLFRGISLSVACLGGHGTPQTAASTGQTSRERAASIATGAWLLQ